MIFGCYFWLIVLELIGESNMGKISNYFKEVKTEVKQAMEDEKEDL